MERVYHNSHEFFFGLPLKTEYIPLQEMKGTTSTGVLKTWCLVCKKFLTMRKTNKVVKLSSVIK